MKPLNLKALFLTSLCLSLTTLAAHAGGSSDGGLNTLKHIPVEDYATDLSDLKGYEVYQKKLALLQKAAPELAAKISENMQKATIYVIPAKIAELPSDTTGLRFSTEQDCYQSGREIFCNEGGMQARTEEKDGMAIMHEALMSVQEKKEARTVRQVNVKLFAKNATPLTVGNALALNHFGAWAGPIQNKIITSYGRQKYYDAIQSYLKGAKESCDKGSSVSGIKSILEFGGYERVSKGKINVIYGRDRAYHNGINSPFAPDMFFESFVGIHAMGAGVRLAADTAFVACVRNPEQMGKEICNELMDDSRLYKVSYQTQYPTFTEEHELRSRGFYSLSTEWENGTMKGMREQALVHIAEHPSFRTLLAMTADPKSLRAQIYEEEAAKCSLKTSAICLDQVLKPVMYRQTELQQRGEINNRQLLCSNVNTLLDDIKFLADHEEENQKKGMFDSPWDLKKAAPIQPPKKSFFPGNDPVDDWSKTAE